MATAPKIRSSISKSMPRTPRGGIDRKPIFSNMNGRKFQISTSPPRITKRKSKISMTTYDSSIPSISIPNTVSTKMVNNMLTIISSARKLPDKIRIDKLDWTNLAQLAIQEDNDGVLSFAISHHISASDIDWMSLIEQAIINSSRYCLEYLLKRIEDLDVQLDWSQLGNIAQKYGEETGNTKVIQYLIKRGYLLNRL